ncbi:MAG: glycosyltransferase family 2 protein [Candidatus Nanohaloarchaea archaeon]
MKAEDKDALSVFMPFYNEEELVEESVGECHSYLKKLEREFELLLVDDGSTDGTPGIIDRLSRELESTRSVHHDENLGYGRALATGFAESRYPLVFYTDGDMQFDIEQLEDFLEDVKVSDLVVGYRKNRDDGSGRKLAAMVFNGLARLLLPVEERDIDCGFKLVKKEVIDDIQLDTERTVDAELLAKAASKGYVIEELPVEHSQRPAGESEASGILGVRPGLVFKSIQELIQIRGEL